MRESAIFIFTFFLIYQGDARNCGSNPAVVYLKRGEKSRIDYWTDGDIPELHILETSTAHPHQDLQKPSGRMETGAEKAEGKSSSTELPLDITESGLKVDDILRTHPPKLMEESLTLFTLRPEEVTLQPISVDEFKYTTEQDFRGIPEEETKSEDDLAFHPEDSTRSDGFRMDSPEKESNTIENENDNGSVFREFNPEVSNLEIETEIPEFRTQILNETSSQSVDDDHTIIQDLENTPLEQETSLPEIQEDFTPTPEEDDAEFRLLHPEGNSLQEQEPDFPESLKIIQDDSIRETEEKDPVFRLIHQEEDSSIEQATRIPESMTILFEDSTHAAEENGPEFRLLHPEEVSSTDREVGIPESMTIVFEDSKLAPEGDGPEFENTSVEQETSIPDFMRIIHEDSTQAVEEDGPEFRLLHQEENSSMERETNIPESMKIVFEDSTHAAEDHGPEFRLLHLEENSSVERETGIPESTTIFFEDSHAAEEDDPEFRLLYPEENSSVERETSIPESMIIIHEDSTLPTEMGDPEFRLLHPEENSSVEQETDIPESMKIIIEDSTHPFEKDQEESESTTENQAEEKFLTRNAEETTVQDETTSVAESELNIDSKIRAQMLEFRTSGMSDENPVEISTHFYTDDGQTDTPEESFRTEELIPEFATTESGSDESENKADPAEIQQKFITEQSEVSTDSTPEEKLDVVQNSLEAFGNSNFELEEDKPITEEKMVSIQNPPEETVNTKTVDRNDDALLDRIRNIVGSVNQTKNPGVFKKTSGFIYSVFRRPTRQVSGRRDPFFQIQAPDLSRLPRRPSTSEEDDVYQSFLKNVKRQRPTSADDPAIITSDLSSSALEGDESLQVQVSGTLPFHRAGSVEQQDPVSEFVPDRRALIRFIESQPLPLRRALLSTAPGRIARHVPDALNNPCDLHVKSDPGLHLLLTFHNLSAPYTVDCHGAYVEIERENNGFEARWCGNPIGQQRGIRSHVIFARSEVRISVLNRMEETDGNEQNQPTGFTADIEVIDLHEAGQQRSHGYSSVNRRVG